MSYIGDFALESTFDLKFTTRQFSTGAPFTLADSPVISAYPDNSTTQITAGITLSVDFDSVTGLNNVRVVATNANGYAAGSNYALVITTGTVDSVSVVGEVIGQFSIAARSALRPTTAGRTLDVTATGAAGVDWGNVENPTTTVDLSATTIDTDQVVASVTGAVGSVTGAVGSVTGNVGGNVTGTIGGLTAAALADFFDTDSGTTYSAAVAGSVVKETADNATVAAASLTAIADALLKRDWTAVSGEADHSVLNALRKVLNRVEITVTSATSGTLTIYAEDGTTAVLTQSVTLASPVRGITAFGDPS